MPEGHFYTSESIIAENYSGKVKGAGLDKTIIEISPGFKALPAPYIDKLNAKIASVFSVY